MVKFCPKCESIFKKNKENTKYICPKCKYEEAMTVDTKPTANSTAAKKNLEKKIALTKTLVFGDEAKTQNIDPTTKVPCPKCGHPEATYFQQQTRSADEPATTFYKCLKCSHSWREY